MRKILVPVYFVVAGCAVTLDRNDALTVLPYEIRSSGRVVIDVRVNDSAPYRFAIDTAASGSLVTSRLANELALEPVPGTEATVFGAVTSGRFPIVDVSRLDIGDIVWNDARVVVLPEATDATSSIDGVLGADFLRRYTIRFDVRERSLYLYQPETVGAKAYRGWESLPMKPISFGNSQESLHFVEIEVGGRSTPALLDLGTGISMLNSPASQDLQLGRIGSDVRGEFSGAIGSETIAAQLNSQALTTGTIRWRDETFLIADPAIFTTLGYADEPLAILGSGLFLQRDFVIDFSRERLLVRTAMREMD